MQIDSARTIINTVKTTLPNDRLPSEEEILALATKLRAVFPLSDNEFSAVLKQLHAQLAIKMDTGVALVETDHVPWLNARKPQIAPFYWDRFALWLSKSDWPPRVIGTLDRVTDDILDLMGDPRLEGKWRRRGLVVGDVQSGKTATYTSLSCKAADAGYRLIILLTGTLESLRRQTQERLDEGFVGLDSSEKLNQQRRVDRAVGVGTIDNRRAAGVFTSNTGDFSKKLMTALGFRLDAFSEPVLVVIKKNKRILQNLESWLRSYNADQNGRIELPMLLIDDEADNASVNTSTSADDPTAINERIRSLLALFTRCTYVGFTATPFANIFIDPETDSEMLEKDLFPRDFIYSLEAPTNYVGPLAFFGSEPASGLLRSINDAEDCFPSSHKSTHVVDSLPASLHEALRTFILTSTIRDLRGEGPTHRSMLVNVSRFTDVQEDVAELIDDELRSYHQEIRNYSQLKPKEALRYERIRSLHDTWSREFNSAGFEWSIVQKALLASALPIVVKSVNQKSGAASLDYRSHKDAGLRVIAVGGNSLSRGLTLEGLSTSYFYRNSQMYDTLLQMGRWFGYRDGYQDLCRLWLTDDAAHWYAHITNASNELRSEVKRMRRLNMTPKDFGLKVRSHPDSLIVTARNKMRLAKTIERVVSLSGEGIETSRLRSNESVIKANAEAVEGFIKSLSENQIQTRKSPWGNTIWNDVPKRIVAALLLQFETHPLNFDFQAREIAAFLELTEEEKLQSWDVVMPQGNEDEISFAGLKTNPQRRFVVLKKDTGSLLVSGSKSRVGSRGIEREGITKELVDALVEKNKGANLSDLAFREIRTRPLLLVHIVTPFVRLPGSDKANHHMDTGGSSQLVALGLSFPYFDDSHVNRRVIYKVNPVEWRSMFEEETDDDQAEDTDEID